MTAYFLTLGITISIMLPTFLHAKSGETLIVTKSDDSLKMDNEGMLVNGTISDKQRWYWLPWDIEGYNTIVSYDPPWGRKRLATKTKSCTNGSSLYVKSSDGASPWQLWNTLYDGTIRSKCGPGWRLRRVDNTVKLINDEPCKVSPDDVFSFVKA